VRLPMEEEQEVIRRRSDERRLPGVTLTEVFGVILTQDCVLRFRESAWQLRTTASAVIRAAVEHFCGLPHREQARVMQTREAYYSRISQVAGLEELRQEIDHVQEVRVREVRELRATVERLEEELKAAPHGPWDEDLVAAAISGRPAVRKTKRGPESAKEAV
jgi:hypothetical protein